MVGPVDDWTYTMRRDMQEIVPGLYLGPYAAAGKKNLGKLEQTGITHIICVRQEIEKNFIKYIIYIFHDEFQISNKNTFQAQL